MDKAIADRVRQRQQREVNGFSTEYNPTHEQLLITINEYLWGDKQAPIQVQTQPAPAPAPAQRAPAATVIRHDAPGTLMYNLTRHWGFLVPAAICFALGAGGGGPLAGVMGLGWLGWMFVGVIHDWNLARDSERRMRTFGSGVGGFLIIAFIVATPSTSSD